MNEVCWWPRLSPTRLATRINRSNPASTNLSKWGKSEVIGVTYYIWQIHRPILCVSYWICMREGPICHQCFWKLNSNEIRSPVKKTRGNELNNYKHDRLTDRYDSQQCDNEPLVWPYNNPSCLSLDAWYNSWCLITHALIIRLNDEKVIATYPKILGWENAR